jgi:hypothetical protein
MSPSPPPYAERCRFHVAAGKRDLYAALVRHGSFDDRRARLASLIPPDRTRDSTNATTNATTNAKHGETNRMASAVIERTKKKLPERLAQVRGDRSQRQFARELGVFQQNVNRYENGTTPHADFLITLAMKEAVSLDWLLLGKGRMKRGR